MTQIDHLPASGPVAPAQSIPPSVLMDRAFRCSPAVLSDKYGDLAKGGWAPKQRFAFGHLTPADWYESLLDAMVTPQTVWLDVGCGRDLLPGNSVTARRLADRCHELVGIDPSDNIEENAFVHTYLKMPIEDHPPGRKYSLITLRMVAEHIESPEAVVRKLSGLLLPGGQIAIYTVTGYSPSVLVASITPLWFHHAVKQFLWRTEERDTFPTVYRMNTRATLAKMFANEALSEDMFTYLGDCKTTARFRFLQYIELSIWKALSAVGLRYPEACILAVYKSTQ